MTAPAATRVTRVTRRARIARSAPAPAPAFDLSFMLARPVVTRQWTHVEIVQVGCGGTGSWLAPSMARLVMTLQEAGRAATLRIVDPDRVERKNIGRQNFCAAEIGLPKAMTMARRLGAAWGLDIPAHVEALEKVRLNWGVRETVRVYVGCVDNAAARQSIHELLDSAAGGYGYMGQPPLTWWLDCGNTEHSGQVLLGSTTRAKDLADAFTPQTICRKLPAPSLQRPELLVALPEEGEGHQLSCAELAAANAQSLMVNQYIAAIAADYLLRLLATGDLRKFATYLDLPSGTTKSLYTTPGAVAAAVGATEEMFKAPPAAGREAAR